VAGSSAAGLAGVFTNSYGRKYSVTRSDFKKT